MNVVLAASLYLPGDRSRRARLAAHPLRSLTSSEQSPWSHSPFPRRSVLRQIRQPKAAWPRRFEKNRNQEAASSWARGRVDAFLQIMQVIDRDLEEMPRAEWERVVSGKGFMSQDEDSGQD